MKGKPILFRAEMVRALLEGRKSQTRRVVKPQPAGAWAAPGKTACPYGQPGDLLWVRETFQHFFRGENPSACYYLADAGTHRWPQARSVEDAKRSWPGWKPSIHMPRWASRLTLRITNVRVERVQDITFIEAKAEGVRYEKGCEDPRDAFQHLWDTMRAGTEYAWERNPWVWAIEFETLRGNIDKAIAGLRQARKESGE